MVGCGTLEEDGTVTWEALAVLWRIPGDGVPGTHSDAPPVANESGGRPHDGNIVTRRRNVRPWVRRDRGKTGGGPKLHGSRMAAYER